MDLAPVYAFGRPVVQPSVANRHSLGVRQINDPRAAQIPASPLAARNAADLRQANGPRQSSSSGDTRHDAEGEPEAGTVQGRGRAAPKRRPALEGGQEQGMGVDVTV